MTNVMVSVIMPVYNCECFINEAIESILNQTFTDFELIVIDDCSTDGTFERIRAYNNERIILIGKQEKTGLVASLNAGIALAKGKYIARMDGDDISNVARLEKQIHFLNLHPEIMLCGTGYELTDTQKQVIYPSQHEDIKIALLDYCPLGHPTVMFRKSFLNREKLTYNKEFEGAEDYELWTRIVWLGKIANIPDVLLTYRSHPDQFSNINKYNQIRNSNLSRIKMLGKLWDPASETDWHTRQLLFQDEPIHSSGKLFDMIEWLDRLINLNKQTNHYSPLKFCNYISAKKKNTIRRFYLQQTNYNPKVLYNFISLHEHYGGCFNITEYLKFVMKCMLFWK